MSKHIDLLLNKKIFLFFLLSLSININAKTIVVNANITSIEPIYTNHTMEKITHPCFPVIEGCWRVSYNKKIFTKLNGYRVNLKYNNKKFIARTRFKPQNKQLSIRIRDDFINQSVNIASNAVVMHQ